MDGTVLKGRSLEVIARLGFKRQIEELKRKRLEGLLKGYEESLKVAKLLKGVPLYKLIGEFDKMGFVNGAKEFISWLKGSGFVTVLVTVSYDVLAERVVKALGIDDFYANKLEVNDGIITGNIIMPLGWQYVKNCMFKSVCKLNVLFEAMRKYNVPIGKTIAIGDTVLDKCMLKYSGLGIAFNPKDQEIIDVADVVVYGDFFKLKHTLENLNSFKNIITCNM
ncbi:MAG: hypothetical protein DRO23_04480 [Thermoprotei archaeon]|nr:MAG: hypothetical protein DRO23_04480 [Thermoprotei archaeon]